jgi:hypothetical protein
LLTSILVGSVAPKTLFRAAAKTTHLVFAENSAWLDASREIAGLTYVSGTIRPFVTPRAQALDSRLFFCAAFFG